MSIPSREIIRTKNLFGVLDCKLSWQSNGDYFLVKVDRAKTKKQVTTSFELYRVREKDIPVDTVEFASTEEITGIFWETAGTRFVVLSQEGQKQSAHFYEVLASQPGKKVGAEALGMINCIRTVDAKGVNYVSWSPKGRFCVLMGLRGSGGALQFWDAEENTLLATEEHYNCSNVEWDHTGRYVTTCVSSWHTQTDTGFMMWSFTGNLIVRQIIPGFKQFLWRPRPASLLTEEDMSKIRKNLKDYSREFDVEDAAEQNKASREVIENRQRQWREWKEYLAHWAKIYESEREERKALYGFDPEEVLQETDDWVEIDESH
jgi:translation initiation factor 3 subunit B